MEFTAANVLLTLQIIDTVAMLVGLLMWIRAGRPADPTSDDFPNVWLTVYVFAFLGWVALLIVDLFYSLWVRDWLGVAIDALLLLWILWEFGGGKGKWKRLKKRLKEKVAVIKDRLVVVPVPAPA